MADETGHDSTLAAELALGLLEGSDLRDAEARRRREPAFADEVDRWERHFAEWFRQWPEVAPPASSRDTLFAATGATAANDNPARRWKIATLLASAVAAVCALFLVIPRSSEPVDTVAAQPAEILAVALTAQDGVTRMPAVIELPRKQLRMPSGLDIPAGSAGQVWLIVGEGAPEPIGILANSAEGLTADLAIPDRVPGNATLAISIEPEGGSPTRLPTGPVVASGALVQI